MFCADGEESVLAFVERLPVLLLFSLIGVFVIMLCGCHILHHELMKSPFCVMTETEPGGAVGQDHSARGKRHPQPEERQHQVLLLGLRKWTQVRANGLGRVWMPVKGELRQKRKLA